MTADGGSDCGGSQDRGKARTTDVDEDPCWGDRSTTGVLDGLDCGDGGDCRRNYDDDDV